VLSERQKQSLLDVYQSFRAMAEHANPTPDLEPTAVIGGPRPGLEVVPTQGE